MRRTQEKHVLLLLLLLWSLRCTCLLALPLPEPVHTWGTSPFFPAVLRQKGAWVDVGGMALAIVLPPFYVDDDEEHNKDAQPPPPSQQQQQQQPPRHHRHHDVLVTYDLQATAHKRYGDVAQDVFSATQTTKARGASTNVVQSRLLVDGVPYRQSACHGSVGALHEAMAVRLSGYLVAHLGPGNHTLTLQWKMQGPHVVSWSNAPASQDGFRGARSLSAWAALGFPHKQLWGAQPLTPATLPRQTEGWTPLPDTAVAVHLAAPMALQFLYAVVVRPDQVYRGVVNPLDQPNHVAARLVVDGAAYRESASSVALTCLVSCTGLLEGDLAVLLPPGRHEVWVEWQRHGPFSDTWRNDPALLDGYAASRSLVALGERQDVLQTASFLPLPSRRGTPADVRVRTSDPTWALVGQQVRTFHLLQPAAVLVLYALPVSQHGHPNFDSWSFERWNAVAARLVVDGLPYMHSGSQVDGSLPTKAALKGQLLLPLAAGTHTVGLQWRADGDNGTSWVALNSMGDGFLGGGLGNNNLLVVVDMQRNVPRLVVVANETAAVGQEDTPLRIHERVFLEDIDEAIADHYQVELRLAVQSGTVAVAGHPGGRVLDLTGSVVAMNAALRVITYQGALDWHGQDALTVTVTDCMYVGDGSPTYTASGRLAIDVRPVNDPPTLTTPGPQRVLEDGELEMRGVRVGDVDGDKAGSVYRVALTVAHGQLSWPLGTSNESSVVGQGGLRDMNAALASIVYRPFAEFNSRRGHEALTITLEEVAAVGEEEEELREDIVLAGPMVATVPIEVVPVNDPPFFEVDDHLLGLAGFGVDGGGVAASSSCNAGAAGAGPGEGSITVVAHHPWSALALGAAADAPLAFSRNLSMHGDGLQLAGGLNTLRYRRKPPFRGEDAVSVATAAPQAADEERLLALLTLWRDDGNATLRISRMAPSRGPLTGSTTVRVEVGALPASQQQQLYCAFGQDAESRVLATILSVHSSHGNAVFACRAPPSPGLREVAVRVTDGLRLWSNSVPFRYDPVVDVVGAQPARGPMQGGMQLTMRLNVSLVPSDECCCVFADAEVVPATAVPSGGSTTVQCLVPPSPRPGPVSVRFSANGGHDLTPTAATFVYEAPVELYAIHPASTPRGAAAKVVVDGNLDLGPSRWSCCLEPDERAGALRVPATAIAVDGEKEPRLGCSFPFIPPGPARAARLCLERISNTTTRSTCDDASPSILLALTNTEVVAVSPSTGAVTGGTVVHVRGRHFRNMTELACVFGASAAVATSFVSPEALRCTAPPALGLGAVPLRVSLDGQPPPQSLPFVDFAYVAEVVLASLAPSFGSPKGGTRVRFRGSGFAGVAAGGLACQFGNQTVAGRLVSPFEVECITPPALHLGEVAAIVAGNGVDFAVDGLSFAYKAPPVLAAASLAVAEVHTQSIYPLHPQQRLVAVEGAFAQENGALTCYFSHGAGSEKDTTRGFLVERNRSTVTFCNLPRMLPLEGGAHAQVAVSWNEQDLSNAVVVSGLDSLLPHSSRVEALHPWQGSMPGGTLIVVRGSGLAGLSSNTTRCVFLSPHDGVHAEVEALLAPDGRSLHCTAPVMEVAGMVYVTVPPAHGVLLFEYLPTPRVASLAPQAASAGGWITILGHDFPSSEEASCVFTSTAGNIRSTTPATWLSGREVVCPMPEAAAEYAVALTFYGQDFLAKGHNFTTLAAPTLTTLWPSWGWASAGGQRLTLLGTAVGLVASTSDAACRFSSTVSYHTTAAAFLNATALQCLVPPLLLAPGEYQVSVVLDGRASSNALLYQVHAVPEVHALWPRVGRQQGGTLVTLLGQHFSADTASSCWFGGSQALSTRVHNGTAMSCVSPPVADVDAVAEVRVAPDVPSGVPFHYVALPRVRDVSPAQGPVRGGTVLRATLDRSLGPTEGSASSYFCRFDGHVTTPAVLHAPAVLTCLSPPSPASGATVAFDVGLQGSEDVPGNGSLPFTYFPDPVIRSLWPAVVGPGTRLVVALVHGVPFLSTVPACRFGPAGTLVAGVWVNGTALACTVPDAGGVAAVAVSAVGVRDFSKPVALCFRPFAARVDAIWPRWGFVSEEDLAVRIHGTGFDVLTPYVADFAGGMSVVASVHSSTVLVCRIPPALGEGEVEVMLSAPLAGVVLGRLAFSFVRDPVVRTVTPALGSIEGNTTLRLNAIFQRLPTHCRFSSSLGNAALVPARVVSAEAVECGSPAWGLGAGPVFVDIGTEARFASRFSSLAATFSYVEPVYVDGLAPRALSLVSLDGATVMVVRGGRFLETPGLACRFGALAAHGMYINATAVACRVPQALQGGRIRLAVTMNGVDFATSPHAVLTVLPAMDVLELVPSRGSTLGNTTIMLRVRPDDAWEGAIPVVRFGEDVAAACAWRHVDDALATLACRTPSASAAGPVDVVIVWFWHGEWVRVSRALLYEYAAPSHVLALHPESGPLAGGTRVAVHTRELFDVGGDLQCRFGSALVPAQWHVETVTCLAPQAPGNATGAVAVTLSVNSGHDVSSTNASFVYYAPLLLGSVAPRRGSYFGGTLVAVHGQGFLPSAICRFAGVVDAVVVVRARVASPETLVCRSPPAAALGLGHMTAPVPVRVGVANNGQEFEAAQLSFTYTHEPLLVAAWPRAGRMGTWVNVTGKNLAANVTCLFGGLAAETRGVSVNTLLCRAPAVKAKATAAVALSLAWTTDVGVRFGALHFTYVEDPAIASVVPPNGPLQGGTVVALAGTGWNSTDVWHVQFGSGALVAAVGAGGGELRAVAPPGDSTATAPVKVYVSPNQGVDLIDTGQTYTYYRQPHIKHLSPHEGPVSGGTIVTVTGDHFSPLPGLRCRFGPAVTEPAVFVDAQHVVCISPNLMLEPAGLLHTDVLVTATLNGVDHGLGASFRLLPHTFESAPPRRHLSLARVADGHSPVRVVSMSPMHGPAAGGTPVLVHGAGFAHNHSKTLGCWFGTLPVPLTVVNDTLAHCSSPPWRGHDTVELWVGGSAIAQPHANASFTYLRAPSAVRITPSAGRVEGGTIVQIAFRREEPAMENLSCLFRSPGGDVHAPVANASCEVPPALTPGVVALTVAHAGQPGAVYLPFEYLSAPVVHRLTPRAALASSSRASSLTCIQVRGQGFRASRSATIVCRFAQQLVDATWHSATHIECCLAPPLPPTPVGWPLSVSLNGGAEFYATNASLQVYPRPAVRKVVDENKDGGPLLLGAAFPNVQTLQCAFSVDDGLLAALLVPASYVNASAVRCMPLPARWPGAALSVGVCVEGSCGAPCSWRVPSRAGARPLHSAMMPSFFPVASVKPTVVSELGGTTLSVMAMTEFANVPGLACRFAGAVDVPAAWQSGQELTCVAPKLPPFASVAVSVVVRTSMVHAPAQDGNTVVHVLPAVALYSVAPSVVSTTNAGTNLRLQGTNLHHYRPLAIPMLCFVEMRNFSATVPVLTFGEQTVECRAPRAPFAGQASVRLVHAGGSPVSGNAAGLQLVDVAAWRDASSITLVPVVAAPVGGTLVQLRGLDANAPTWVTLVGRDEDGTEVLRPVPLVHCDETHVFQAPADLEGSTVRVHPWGVVLTYRSTSSGKKSLTADTPTLLALRPQAGVVLGGTRVTVVGRGFLRAAAHDQAMACLFGGVPAPEPPVLVSDHEVVCIAPGQRSIGRVSLTMPPVDGELPFDYRPQPVVHMSEEVPGEEGLLRLYGAHFLPLYAPWSCVVGDGLVTKATVVDAHILQCQLPLAIGAAPVTLRVAYNGGANDALGPSSLIHGGNRTARPAAPSPRLAWQGTTTRVTVAGVPQTVGCTNDDFASVGGILLPCFARPTLTAVTPTRVSEKGNTTLLLRGRDILPPRWGHDGKLFCQFSPSTTLIPARWLSSEAVECGAPAHQPGRVEISLLYNGNLSSTSLSFAFHPVVTVSSVAAADEGWMDVYGTNFVNVPELGCRFVGPGLVLEADLVLYRDALHIRCLAPAFPLQARAVHVQVTVNGVEYFPSESAPSSLLVPPLPIPSAMYMHPTNGHGAGGTNVSIHLLRGQERGRHASAYACCFGPIKVAATLLPGPSGSMWCVAPSQQGDKTVVDLRLATGGHSAGILVGEFTYTLLLVLSEATLAGGQRPVAHVKGAHFHNSRELLCRWTRGANNTLLLPVSRQAAWESPSTLVCPLPPMAAFPMGTWQLEVSNNGQEFAGPVPLTIVPRPSIVSVVPPRGLAQGGTLLVVRGKGIVSARSHLCRFAGDSFVATTPATYVNATALRCTTPLFPPAGDVRLSIVTDDAESEDEEEDMGAVVFAFVAADGLRIAALMPESGAAQGGTPVFVQVHSVDPTLPYVCRFRLSADTWDAIGVVPAYNISHQGLTCNAPPLPPRLTVENAAIVPAVVDLAFEAGDFPDVSRARFAYRPGPHLHRVYPARGPEAGGTALRIHASKLTPSACAYCHFAFDPATNATLVRSRAWEVDATTADCLTPALSILSPPVSTVVYVGLSLHGDRAGGPHDVVWTSRAVFTFDRAVRVVRMHPRFGPAGRGQRTLLTIGVCSIAGGATAASSSEWVCRFRDKRGAVLGLVPARAVEDHSIACMAPARAMPGPVMVEVAQNAIDFVAAAEQFEYYAAPQVRGLHPSTGNASGGTLVKIHGQDFPPTGLVSCRFGGIAVTNGTWQSPEAIACQTPGLPVQGPDAALTRVAVALSFNGVDFHEESLLSFTYNVPLVIDSIQPPAGSFQGGTVVTVQGTFFPQDRNFTCRFGEQSLTAATWVSRTMLECRAPEHPPGSVAVAVTLNGQEYYGNKAFEYVGPVELVEMAGTDAGPVTGGTRLTIQGRNLQALVGRAVRCLLGTASSPAEMDLLHQHVVCRAPPQTTSGPVAVRLVVARDGADMVDLGRPLTEELHFHYVAPLSLVSVTPTLVHPGMVTVLTVRGHGFVGGSRFACRLALRKDVAPVVCPGVLVASSLLECACSLPALAEDKPLPASMEVSQNGGADFSLSGLSVQVVPVPTIDRLSPPLGPATGGTLVRVYGKGFLSTDSVQCRFGDDSRPVMAWTEGSTESMWCRTSAFPSFAPQVPVSVSVNGVHFVASNGSWFTVHPNVKVGEVEPRLGYVSGGTTVTVRGSNFAPTRWLRCHFGGQAVLARFVARDQVACITPAFATPRELHVGVSLNGGVDVVYDRTVFRVVADLQLLRVQPVNGPLEGGTRVTVTGHGFANTSALACRFGDAEAPVAAFVSSTSVVCVAPPRAAASTVFLSVALNGVDFSMDDVALPVFHYSSAPLVANVSRHLVPERQPASVIVRGAAFLAPVDGGQPACRTVDTHSRSIDVAAQWLSPSAILCPIRNLIRPDAPYALYVSNNGQDFVDSDVAFAVDPQFLVLDVSPAYGSIEGGTRVTVTLNTHLAGTQKSSWSCRFGSIAVPAAVSVTDPMELWCVSPASLLSRDVPFAVAWNGGLDGAQDDRQLSFTYLPAPHVRRVSPALGPREGGTTVMVTVADAHTLLRLDAARLSCRFAWQSKDTFVPAAIVSTDNSSMVVQCISPPFDASGRISVQVVDSEEPALLGHGGSFRCHRAPHILSIAPRQGSERGGTVVSVSGAGFLSTRHLACRFGHDTVPATWQSRTLLTCVVPRARVPGYVSVGVTLNGQDVTEGTAVFHYDFALSAADVTIAPLVGPRNGGTTLFLKLSSPRTVSAPLQCRFAGAYTIPARLVNSTTMACPTPAVMALGAVPVELSLNGQDYLVVGSFEYVATPVLRSIDPDIGWHSTLSTVVPSAPVRVRLVFDEAGDLTRTLTRGWDLFCHIAPLDTYVPVEFDDEADAPFCAVPPPSVVPCIRKKFCGSFPSTGARLFLTMVPAAIML